MMLFPSVIVLAVAPTTAAVPTTAAEHEASFQARWYPELATAAAPASIGAENVEYPSHCKLAVVGAGWGGAYLAWRLAVDTQTVNASDVCIFEANGRVGGRIYSIHGLPSFADVAVDAGGYRFQETQRLPADLVWSALKMPTTCYNWDCSQSCEGNTCYVIKDAYGNNAGYAAVIERMLGEVEAAGGPGKQVYFAAPLTRVSPAPSISASASTLKFANGQSVTADRVVLNMPGNAIENLAKGSSVFEGTKYSQSVLDAVSPFSMNKVYAWYDDAWWNTKLGLMEGYFTGHGGKAHKFAAPLHGRYHDGPQRCVIGKDTAGQPVYSGKKILKGNCSGAIEVYYTGGAEYYQGFMSSKLQPLTVVTGGDSNRTMVEQGAKIGDAARNSKLLEDVHAHLVAHHAPALQKAGVDPKSIAKPKTIVLSNWIVDGAYTPGIGHLYPPNNTTDDMARKAARKPVAQYELYVVNQDYGYKSGWAVGSLAMAEKILQADIGLKKPSWLQDAWYQEWVLAHP